jgi:DNA-damage-inducible protein D
MTTKQKTELSIAGALKKANQHGAEYWSARDLQPLLGYSQWRRFEQAIDRAVSFCKQSGNPPEHHFAGTGKPIPGGKGAVQIVDDYYLIAQNGDFAACAARTQSLVGL